MHIILMTVRRVGWYFREDYTPHKAYIWWLFYEVYGFAPPRDNKKYLVLIMHIILMTVRRVGWYFREDYTPHKAYIWWLFYEVYGFAPPRDNKKYLIKK